MNFQEFQKCPKLLQEYLVYLTVVRGCSSRTTSAYYGDLSLFLRFIKATKVNQVKFSGQDLDLNQISIEDLDNAVICGIDLTDIHSFLNYVAAVRGNSSVTRARKIGSLKSFYNYIFTKTTLMPENPTADLSGPIHRKRLPKYLNLDETKAFLKVIKNSDNPRDFCIFTLLLNCGMRLTELVSLNVSDFDLTERTLRLLGKGGKERIIYLNRACLMAIGEYAQSREYLLAKHHQNSSAFFLSSRGNRISGRRVEQIMKKYLTAVGLADQGYTPHKLRHTAATLMYQSGVADILVLQRLLGHSSLSTTAIYTHASDKQMRDAMDHSPLGVIGSELAASD